MHYYLPRSASWMEEMEKRSRRRTRDLVTQAASRGLSENEIGCARISMMARSTNAPCKGRIQMRKTNPLHFFTFGLQRTAGPYRWVKRYKWFIDKPDPGVRFDPKTYPIPMAHPVAHASRLCNRAEEYEHAGSSDC